MSETMPEIDDFGETPDESDQFKAMRARANKATKLEKQNSELSAELDKLRRQVAFTSAGLSLTEKQQAALLAAHGDAELTADALKATAVELGFAQAATTEQAQLDQVAAAQARIGSAQAGSAVPEPLPDIPTQILAAEQEGDWDRAMNLKAQQVAAMLAG